MNVLQSSSNLLSHAKYAIILWHMKVICFIFVLLLGSILCPFSWGAEVLMSTGCLPADTGRVQRPDSLLSRDSLRTDTLREVVVKPDSVLQIMKVLKKTTKDKIGRAHV